MIASLLVGLVVAGCRQVSEVQDRVAPRESEQAVQEAPSAELGRLYFATRAVEAIDFMARVAATATTPDGRTFEHTLTRTP